MEQRVGDDEDAERRAGDDDEFERLHQHFEMAAERRIAAEDAADGDDQTDDEIHVALLPLASAPANVASVSLREAVPRQASFAQVSVARSSGGLRRSARVPLGPIAGQLGSSGCRTDSMSPFPGRSPWSGGLQTIATNVANMNTVGYRADGVSFEAQMAKAGDTRRLRSPATDRFHLPPVRRDHQDRQSARRRRPGRRLARHQAPPGVVYTRDGRMTISESGELDDAERLFRARRRRRADPARTRPPARRRSRATA